MHRLIAEEWKAVLPTVQEIVKKGFRGVVGGPNPIRIYQTDDVTGRRQAGGVN
jgi:hypothetical protein